MSEEDILNPLELNAECEYLREENNQLKEDYKRMKENFDSKVDVIGELKSQLDLYKSVFDEIKEIIETKFLETELYGGELVCISVGNYKKVKTMLDKVGGSNE